MRDRSTLDISRYPSQRCIYIYATISRWYIHTSIFSLFFFLFLYRCPSAFSFALPITHRSHIYYPRRIQSHSTAITERCRCRKPAVVILAVYCATSFSLIFKRKPLSLTGCVAYSVLPSRVWWRTTESAHSRVCLENSTTPSFPNTTWCQKLFAAVLLFSN